jgi:hypothetical protein
MKRRLFISFLILVIMVITMRQQGKSLLTPVSLKGIINLELAKTPERFHQLQLFWNSSDVISNIFLDFLFIAAYTWFFVNGCRFVKQKLKLQDWSDRFLSLAIAAAFFDVCENFLMLLVWNGRFGTAVLQIIFYCAVIKFLLIGLVALYLLITLPVALLFKKRSLLS